MKEQASETGPQRRILEVLRRDGPRTATELSAALGGGPVSMRVHLRSLLAAGLVEHESERRAVGRPVRRFRLAAAADALFPKQYDRFAVALAEAVAGELGERALLRILRRWVGQLHGYLDAKLPREPAARVEALARHQSSYGFMASVRKERRSLVVLEQNCPIARVAAEFPQICDHEAELFTKVLGRDVALEACQARGDTVCEFRIGAAGHSTVIRAPKSRSGRTES